MVHDPVLFTGRRHGALPGAKLPFFSSDSKSSLTFEHQVDLILFAMDMTLCSCPGSKQYTSQKNRGDSKHSSSSSSQN